MRVINQKAKKFAVGKEVIVKKRYESGATILILGQKGLITGNSTANIPDMWLFNIRVIDLLFSNCILSVSEVIANEYFEEL
jgi:hypothetical protein